MQSRVDYFGHFEGPDRDLGRPNPESEALTKPSTRKPEHRGARHGIGAFHMELGAGSDPETRYGYLTAWQAS